MGLCGGSGDADGPHELIDVLIPIAIIAGVCIGMQDRIAGGKVQCCRVDDIGTDVLLSAVGALCPDYDLTLYTAGVRRVGDVGVRGIVDALCVLHGLGFVSIGDGCQRGVVLLGRTCGFGAWNA